ncbi:cytochrome c [Ignatzschineria larvae DSM 13226]|uniref:Cytochrome c n=1 Tax=Ignatzschineria larvae DSM 13226 TaxID=1111732 RepID=A0ABZ3C055_9GAMM|nr:cytochrome c [Ignatzschineria larvae]
MKTKTVISRTLIAIIGIGVIGAVALNFYKGPTSPLSTESVEPSTALIERGAYLAQLGDCTSCHTSNSEEPFAGGLAFELPIGTLYSPNITPDKTEGIGDYTLSDFDNAVRFGIRKDGKSLYPAMPFPDYAVLKEEDIKALYAYFLYGVKPLNIAEKANGITWPLSMRWPLTAWRLLYSQTPKAFDDGQYSDPEIARGAYLVQGLGHCGSCHTPRGLAINEKSYSESDNSYLSGGSAPIDGWIPINLRGDNHTGLGHYSVEELTELLATGRSKHHAVFGSMEEVINNSLQYGSEEDIRAMAKYLKSLTPVEIDNPAFVYDESTHEKLVSGDDSARGASHYIDSCAACHRTTGLGYDGVFPALAGNPSLQNANPISAINIIAQGSISHGTTHAPTVFEMPDMATDRLSDEQIADLATFIRTSWGNKGTPVSVSDVEKVLK